MGRHHCKLDDSGVTLEAFDRPKLAAETSTSKQPWDSDRSSDALRRLSHKLRPVCHDVATVADPVVIRGAVIPTAREEGPYDDALAPPWDSAPAGRMAWGVTLLLAAGLAMLLAGVGSLAWSIRLADAQAAHWGITAGLGGVGLLVVAIARLTARVWRNSRRVAVQLEGMNERLEAMRGIAATAALVRGAERCA